jgi:hypothetical protein
MILRIITRAVTVLGLLAVPFSCVAAGPYSVSVSLAHLGKVFAAPTVVVSDGVPATIEVSAPDAYSLTITVKSAGHDRLMVETNLKSAYGSAHPAMVVLPGQTASATVGDIAISVNARHADS